MTTWWRHILELVLALALVVAVPQLVAAQRDFDAPFPAHRVMDNVYFVGTEGLGSYLVVTPDGHILINADFERTVPMIRESVEALGFEFGDIAIVLGSHAHSDHMQGSTLVKELTGARVMHMAEDLDLLGGMSTSGREQTVDRVLSDGDTVVLGGATLTAHLTPGHTPGCTSWGFEIEEAGETYDVLIVCSYGVNANYVLVGNVDYPEIVDDYRTTFVKARDLPVDVFLGSHGFWYDVAGKYARAENRRPDEPNPFIDPAGYRDHVDLQEANFLEMLDTQEAEAR
jgi:metallo-beta-lactamase class B